MERREFLLVGLGIVLTERDDVDGDLVLLQLSAKLRELLLGGAHWRAHEEHDALFLHLVLTITQRQLAE